ncbi:MAG: hypothetical protein AAGN35_26120 [Bacteroidota bacterium]
MGKSGQTVPSFIDEIGNELFDGESDPKKETDLAFLCTILSTDTAIATIAKTIGMISENDNLFLETRIVTDIRPILASEIDSAISNAMILHKLRIGYHHNAEYNEIYFTPTDKTLELLEVAIQRARQKSEALENQLGEANISIFNLNQ